MKIRPVGIELFRANGQMDTHTHMTKLIVAFRNFGTARKNVFLSSSYVVTYYWIVYN